MSTKNSRRGRVRRGMLFFWLIAVGGCGGAPEESSETPTHSPTPPAAEVEVQKNNAEEPVAALPSSPSSEETCGPPGAAFISHASVLANKELGMSVTGKGAEEPGRSLAVLEQQVLAFLPQLQEIYERERELDPSLMGSLDVNLTIEPGGAVSDLRFPLRRVSSEKLISAVFDRMRTWSFSPAEEPVQLRYRLLFVPSGIDQASVLTWEKQLGGHAVVERNEERRVAAAPAPTPPKKPASTLSSSMASAKVPEPVRPVVSGWYRVSRPTVLWSAPRTASEVVTRLPPGTRIRVVGMIDGEWLEVRSVSNRPPGFLQRGDARPEADERAGLP